MNSKIVHLVCNAHIDPVWLWRRFEGRAEVISTFRTAAQLCEENQCFVFNQGESMLYEWVQESDPDLFSRIKKLVAAGKWNIIGGWYSLPDCNMPSGESIVRQIFHGKKYFRRTFGVDVTTSSNPDSFGHSRGIVQLLAKSGFDSYLFGRPDNNDCPLPLNGDAFIWTGYDGSTVLATRFTGWYSSKIGKACEKIQKWLQDNKHKKFAMILWGVGNHGGGPSRKDLQDINAFIETCSDHRLAHSTPQKYFDELKLCRHELETFSQSLNRWGVGCYTSMAQIKRNYRSLENEIYTAEKMLTSAACLNLLQYPQEQIDEALKDLMFIQHHDILPGTCSQSAEHEALRILGHGRDIAARLSEKAFLALVQDQQKPDNSIPFFVYNHHPYKVQKIIEAEYTLPDQYRNGPPTHAEVMSGSQKLTSQMEKEECYWAAEWRKRIVFRADLLPGQINRFDIYVKDGPPAQNCSNIEETPNAFIFKGQNLTFQISKQTGFVDALIVNGRPFLKNNAFVPVIMHDNEDPWLMQGDCFSQETDRFALCTDTSRISPCMAGEKSVRIIENGPVRCIIECHYTCRHSTICYKFKLPVVGTEIELEMLVNWQEKDRALKLEVPTLFAHADCLAQSIFGFEKLLPDGKENVMQKWAAVVSQQDDAALTCINDSVYGLDWQNGCLKFTLLRSPAYTASRINWQQNPKISQHFSSRIDQGQHCFKFWFNAGTVDERMVPLHRESLIKNEEMFSAMYFPAGSGKEHAPLVTLSDDAVIMSALKFDNNGNIIIRLHEPTGKSRKTDLSMPLFSKNFPLQLKPFEIKTLCYDRLSGRLEEVDLLEQTEKNIRIDSPEVKKPNTFQKTPRLINT